MLHPTNPRMTGDINLWMVLYVVLEFGEKDSISPADVMRNPIHKAPIIRSVNANPYPIPLSILLTVCFWVLWIFMRVKITASRWIEQNMANRYRMTIQMTSSGSASRARNMKKLCSTNSWMAVTVDHSPITVARYFASEMLPHTKMARMIVNSPGTFVLWPFAVMTESMMLAANTTGKYIAAFMGMKFAYIVFLWRFSFTIVTSSVTITQLMSKLVTAIPHGSP